MTMRIVRLSAENFKRLVAVDITPTGNMVELTGKNGQGKSSVLDALWVVLAGLEAAPRHPIRKGQASALIKADLGDIIVTRSFTLKEGGGEATSKLTIESKDGAKYSSPQAMLDKMLGRLSFDPQEFERMDARAQFNALRVFVPGVDFDGIEQQNKAAYELRAGLNRQSKQYRQAAALSQFLEDVANEKVPDDAALVAELEQAGKHNAEIEQRKANRERVRIEVVGLRAEVEREIAAIKHHEDAIAACRTRLQSLEEQSAVKQARIDAAPALPLPIDTGALTVKIREARDRAAVIQEHQRRREQHRKLIAQAEDAERKAEELTLNMDKREVEKREAIAAAKFPVDGISFGDNEVLLNGVPFVQASDAERLCCSIALAMAMNPKLRIIRVRDGSLLDDDSMKLLARMAEEKDYQVWIERVDGSGRVGVVIEDGRVKPTQGTQ
jgi:DNA repair exonuclease SbcCD ATPase subunit